MVRDRSGDSLESLVVAAQHLRDASTVDELLQQIVDSAVATVAGCAYAGVSTDRNGQTSSPVVSEPAVLAIDSLQYSINAGPCLLAMRGPEPFIDAPDLEHDPRFVPFGEAAAGEGCRAVLAHRLYVDSETLGSLNLYARDPGAYTEDDRRTSVVLASLASLALNVLRLEIDGEGLRAAVKSRDVIGQAKGILMERDGLNADEAFATLRIMSQHRNVKLRELARLLSDERGAGTDPS